MRARRRARIAVLQALFETDVVEHEANYALEQRLLDASLPTPTAAFSRRLLRGIVAYRVALDAVLQRIAPERPLDQISPVDRNILRLSAYEVLLDDDTPPKVVINEAVELAKMFGSESSSRFVNGVLGTILSQRNEIVQALGVPKSDGGEGTAASSAESEPG